MLSVRCGLRRGGWLVFGLLCLGGGCSERPLDDGVTPEACNFPLPHRCDICATGETVCAHYVIRNGVCTAETCPSAPSRPDSSHPVQTTPDASMPDASLPDASRPDASPPVEPTPDASPLPPPDASWMG